MRSRLYFPLYIFALLVTYLGYSVSSYAQVLTSFGSGFSHSEQLLSQRDCFYGERSSYDSWKNSVVNSGKLDSKKFEQYYPKDVYEKYKRSFECYLFVYSSSGYKVKGYVVLPKQSDMLTSFPVVIFNRGGNNVAEHALRFSQLFKNHFPLAEAGYIVISSQYRGAQVWKRDNPQEYGMDEFGGKDVDDVVNLMPVIQGIPSAASDRIGMMGWSRGGMMSLLAAKRMKNIKALVLGGTPVDLVTQAKNRPEMEKYVYSRLIPNYAQNKEQELESRSALFWPESLPSSLPILMFHGTADSRVSVQGARQFNEKMKALSRPIKYVEYEKGTHGLWENIDNVRELTTSWFTTYL